MKLNGRVAIVTGASRGIGRAIAETFAGEGCNLTIASRNLDEITRAAYDIRRHGTDVLPVACDVSSVADVEEMVKRTIDRFKKIDILVNNAGIYGPFGAFVDNDFELWKKTIDINLMGTVICTKLVLPHMIAKKSGKIINLSGGGSGGPPTPTISAYVTSKMAVVRFTEVVAEEVKDYNIQVNSIAPGPVNTRLLDQVLEAKEKVDRRFLEKALRQKETGGVPPERAADLALFLASDESNGITGKLISAVWDDYRSFGHRLEEINRGSIYTVRRVDGRFYREVRE